MQIINLRSFVLLICALALCFNAAISAKADELILNGGFETGDFTNWTVANQDGSSEGGDFFVLSGTTTPVSNSTTVGPSSGTFYAVSDQAGQGTHSLLQTFTVSAPSPSVILSFDLFANNQAGTTIIDPAGLDFNAGANQHARVDLLRVGGSAFSTDPADVLQNFFIGADPSGVNPYTSYTFNITSAVGAGGTFQLRFAEVDNQLFFNLGVDNVSVQASTVPEPATMLLLGTGLAGLGGMIRRRRQGKDK